MSPLRTDSTTADATAGEFAGMPASDAKSLPSIGFLTVRNYDELGLIGGYLLLNVNGRPLEFHCTAPVRANRAQEILYGPTLKPFLYGEQIGKTLFAKGKTKPMFVCTDVEAVLALRNEVDRPVILLEVTSPDDESTRRLDAAHNSPEPHLVLGELDGHAAACSKPAHGDLQAVAEQWAPHAGNFELIEPFARLGEAIEETQSGVSR